MASIVEVKWKETVIILLHQLFTTKPIKSWKSMLNKKTHYETKVGSRIKAYKVAQDERIKCANTAHQWERSIFRH
ncbi:hypothetical protein EVAR_37743_1 [Eumeta japonica]|uniref:Uncharacterized protein n=1 Tax=Eumeta variegata TaxID=151549 RepID=A0A4C1WLL6_EUMVA|nr:hypothetical protein EVAR_37743_1 [Eumeta japonica]